MAETFKWEKAGLLPPMDPAEAWADAVAAGHFTTTGTTVGAGTFTTITKKQFIGGDWTVDPDRPSEPNEVADSW